MVPNRNYFGKHHAPNCTCDIRFTCRACLDNAPKYFWTPNKPGEQQRQEEQRQEERS